MIPEFPQSREVTLADKPLFDAVFAARPPELSAYTFTNIFAWREVYGTSVSRLAEHLLVLHDHDGRCRCLEPLGDPPIAPVMEEVFSQSSRVSAFERVSSSVVSELRSPRLVPEPDRDNWDYLYFAEDMISLAGRRYDAKRNHIAKARAAAAWEYVKLDGQTALECEEFAEYWCEDRQCETVEGLRRESCAVYQMLSNFESLGIIGGAIRVDGAIVAFTLGEALNPETLVIHVEKADARIEGLYQLINNEFCKAEANGFRFINREQDLGIPGLRKAKQSYHPVRMVESFRVRRA